jgi:tetratricopeptide (TPR) repeat protein
MAHVYLRQGRFEEAAAAYREALGPGGGHPALNINLGAALAQLGRTEEALEALRIAVAKVPESADAHANLANVLTVKQDWQGARRHYEIALRLNPRSVAARQGLARLDAAGR